LPNLLAGRGQGRAAAPAALDPRIAEGCAGSAGPDHAAAQRGQIACCAGNRRPPRRALCCRREHL